MSGGEIAILAAGFLGGAAGLFASGFVFGLRRGFPRLFEMWSRGAVPGSYQDDLDRIEWAWREVREHRAAERRRAAAEPKS